MESHCSDTEELSIITSSDSYKYKSSAAIVAFAESPVNLESNITTAFSLSSLHQRVSELCGPNWFFNVTDAVRVCSGKRKRFILNCEVMPSSKRRLTLKFRDENGMIQAMKGFQCTCPEVIFQMYDFINHRITTLPRGVTTINNFILTTPLIEKLNIGQTSCKLRNIGLLEGGTAEKVLEETKVYKETVVTEPDAELALPSNRVDNGAVTVRAKRDGIDFKSTINHATTMYYTRRKKSLFEVRDVDGHSKLSIVGIDGDRIIMEGQVEEPPVAAFRSCKEESKNLYKSLNTMLLDKPHKVEYEMVKNVNNDDTALCFGKDQTSRRIGSGVIYPAAKSSIAPEQLSEYSDKTVHGDAMSRRIQPFCESLEKDKAIIDIVKKCSKLNQMPNKSVEKFREDDCGDVHDKGKKRSNSISQKDNVENKSFPTFESYVVEEEEGSGGYGTVYRARRKNHGTTVAIKCPHANAQRHHIRNEQRMLERFGGKNFVIKYEGCFKNGNTDCSVLEHVEHDRPEVLKKEMDVIQLQWYGYCMFKALASLHKQGINHRDVKPGNFLFSCKTNKGYLIDFNLAMDLHQKYGNPAKQKVGHDLNIKNVKFDNAKYVLETKDIKGSKSTLDQNSLRKKALNQIKSNNNYLSNLNISKSQGADGSGITSTRDATSTVTPSAERLREPLPCHGRKELINLVQKARQSPKGEVSSVPVKTSGFRTTVPSPLRKRVAAPGNVDSTLVYLTPMPLHSALISLGVSGSMNIGDGKQKREGPCVGTKGFRAPEVLLRSPYQGPKVDIWSAGVTLLYLMIGTTPFVGDPEQNIKDIAKLRGSEDLWEVAKLHNRESSFPTDLYKAEFLPSVKLRDWCELNTKRPGFFKKIPALLFDLVDKCLTVNPRLRISAEESLKHEFFAPCHEALRKQRLYRRVLSQNSISDSSHDQNIIKQTKRSKLKA